MKDLAKKSGYISLLTSIAFLLLGIILVNHPEDTIKVVSYILGGIFIIFGVIKMITYFSSKEDFVYYDFNLMLGSLCILVGIVVLVFGNAIASLIGIIFGIWIVLSSINRINLSIKMRDSKIKYWYVSLIIAVLLMICGLYVIFAPEIVLVTLGTILIVYSIVDIIQNIAFIINIDKLAK